MKQVDRVLLHGHIDPRVKQYWLFLAVIASFVTVVGVPFLPFTLLIAWLLIDRYVASIRCDLTDRSLVIHKGVLTKVESIILLTKITDLQMHQGPIMRLFGLKAFRVETAGQSSGAGAISSTWWASSSLKRSEQRCLLSASASRRAGRRWRWRPPALAVSLCSRKSLRC